MVGARMFCFRVFRIQGVDRGIDDGRCGSKGILCVLGREGIPMIVGGIVVQSCAKKAWLSCTRGCGVRKIRHFHRRSVEARSTGRRKIMVNCVPRWILSQRQRIIRNVLRMGAITGIHASVWRRGNNDFRMWVLVVHGRTLVSSAQ